MTDPSPSSATSNESSNEIAWLAMCYVLDELDDTERSQFEAQLAVDQTARDRLVEAVQVLDACGSATSSPEKSSPVKLSPATARTNRRRWLAVATLAASVAVMVGVWSLTPQSPPREESLAQHSSAPAPDTAEIVSRWTAYGSTDGEFSIQDDPIDDAETELMPPDWLLAAVAYEESAAPAISPFNENPSRVERN